MANKSKMKCNVVKKKSLYTLEQKDMDIIIHLLQERASRHVTSVERQKAN